MRKKRTLCSKAKKLLVSLAKWYRGLGPKPIDELDWP
jgi:hypothetical protein